VYHFNANVSLKVIQMYVIREAARGGNPVEEDVPPRGMVIVFGFLVYVFTAN
jgi:hypothetical protein